MTKYWYEKDPEVKAEIIEETKAKVSEEFVRRFYEWLKDEAEMSDSDYGRKYGYSKPKEPHKDNVKAVMVFQKYMFCACRNLCEWEDKGYNGDAIYELRKQGFLSEQLSKWKTYYYISQKTAKQIYKEYKA